MKANIVDDFDLLINKGDIMIVVKSDGSGFGMIMCCPHCGRKTGGNHNYNPETISTTPSLVHNTDLGGCGWHGFLTNGEFTPV